jgi:hypothetical protein
MEQVKQNDTVAAPAEAVTEEQFSEMMKRAKVTAKAARAEREGEEGQDARRASHSH